MTLEKWQNIVGQIKDNFPVEEHEKIHTDEEGGTDSEHIIFTGPLGRMKLVFTAKPVVLDKKTIYSRRIGSETKVEYVYSDEEKAYRLAAFKWDEGQDDWIEIDSRMYDR